MPNIDANVGSITGHAKVDPSQPHTKFGSSLASRSQAGNGSHVPTDARNLPLGVHGNHLHRSHYWKRNNPSLNTRIATTIAIGINQHFELTAEIVSKLQSSVSLFNLFLFSGYTAGSQKVSIRGQ